MAFSPDQLKAVFKEPAKSHNFEVLITSPIYSIYEDSEMRFKCESIEFPGRSAQTTDYRQYGTLQKIAYNTIYQDLTMSVLVSSGYKEVEYFNGWFDAVVGKHRTNRFEAPGPTSSIGFDVNYFDEYRSSLNIIAYDQTGNVTRNVKLIDAYPIIINPIALNWNSNDIVRLNVTMTYRYWKDEEVEAVEISDSKIITKKSATKRVEEAIQRSEQSFQRLEQSVENDW